MLPFANHDDLKCACQFFFIKGFKPFWGTFAVPDNFGEYIELVLSEAENAYPHLVEDVLNEIVRIWEEAPILMVMAVSQPLDADDVGYGLTIFSSLHVD